MSPANTGFIENKGQIVDDQGNDRSDILFTFRSPGATVFIGKKGLHYLFFKADSSEKPHPTPPNTQESLLDTSTLKYSTYRLDVELVGSKSNPEIITEKATGYYENYYLAHCPEGITFARAFEKITLKDVYPGIDWVFYQYEDFIKYDFVVHPGADPSHIQLQFKGATDLQLNKEGDLIVSHPFGKIMEQAPTSYDGEIQVSNNFVLRDSTLSFDVKKAASGTLVIDPIIEWGTYYGYGVSELAFENETDSSGNVYLSGTSYKVSMNMSSGGHQNSHAGYGDALLVKFNSAGVRQWATYYGGAKSEYGYSCSVDPHQNVYLAGTTSSLSGISYAGHQMQRGNPTSPTFYTQDGYLAKFDSQGVRLWGTYYGGDGNEFSFTCGTDKNSNVFLVGFTGSTNNIAFNGFKDTLTTTGEAFVVKFDSTGTRQWGTYFGANFHTNTYSGAVDHLGNIFIYGEVQGAAGDSGIAYQGFQNSLASQKDLYIAKFSPTGARIWSTYFGGPGEEMLHKFRAFSNSCAVDKNGNFYISGSTTSSSGIATPGLQNSFSGTRDCFLAKFSRHGPLEWATYFGGPYEDLGFTCTVDQEGDVFLGGQTLSTQGVAHNGFQNSIQGPTDAFLAKFNHFGELKWATYLGGEDDDVIVSCEADETNNIYVCGDTESSTGIAFKGFQNTHLYGSMGRQNAFLMKFQGCSTNTLDTISACQSFYWPLKDTTFTISGLYSDTTIGLKGCDSLVQLYLNIYQPTELTQPVVTCDEYTWPASGKTYSTSTSDTAVLQSAHGCDSIVILNLTINKSSNSSLTDTVCITYTSPSGKFTWTKSGTYTDTITNSKGCDSIITINLHVKEVETGVVRVDSALIAEAQNASYQWLNCQNSYSEIDGEKKALFKPLFNGSYAVAITQNGCSDTSACYTITGKESIDNPFGTSMAIFPNPTTGVLYVRFGEPVEGVHIAIWNSAGKLLSTQNFDTTDRFALNIPWADGVYYLKISNVYGKSVIIKVVKI